MGSGVSSFQSEAAAYADKWTIVLPDDFSDRLLEDSFSARDLGLVTLPALNTLAN